MNMAPEEKRKWLAAIGELERFYRAVVAGEQPEYFPCPFCILVKQACFKCLWRLILHRYCGGVTAEGYRRAHDIPWAKSSLRRLARWRMRLEEK